MERKIMNSANSYNYEKMTKGIFRNLKCSTRAQIQERMVLCRYEDAESIDAEKIFSGEKIWALLAGELHLVMRDEGGKTIVLMKITSENCGFILPTGCLDSMVYSIEAVCVGKTQLCYLPESLSREIYRECDSIKQWQHQCYTEMFSKLLELINDLTFLSLKDRLKKKLWEYCCLYETDTILVTHEELAEELATSREVISRLLKKMETEHTIKIKRKSIQMLGWENNDRHKKRSQMVS